MMIGLHNIQSCRQMAVSTLSLQYRKIKDRHWEMDCTRIINLPGTSLALKTIQLTQEKIMVLQEQMKSLYTHWKICLTVVKLEESKAQYQLQTFCVNASELLKVPLHTVLTVQQFCGIFLGGMNQIQLLHASISSKWCKTKQQNHWLHGQEKW